MIGWRGQQRGGAIVGDGPSELYSSNKGQHVSAASSSSFLGALLGVLVLAGGWRSLGLVGDVVGHSGGLCLSGVGLVLLLEQLLFLQLVQMLMQVLLLILILLVLLGLLELLLMRLLMLELLPLLLLLLPLLLLELLLLLPLLLLLLNLELLVVLLRLLVLSLLLLFDVVPSL